MHKRTYEWNVCFARGQVGSFGFQKVGASAERTVCADRGLRDVMVQAYLCRVLELGARGETSTPTHAGKGMALAFPRSKGSVLLAQGTFICSVNMQLEDDPQ